jgi:hypothetical protein
LASGVVMAQDSTKVKTFDYSKFQPMVHFFANAEMNLDPGITEDNSLWIGRAQFGFNYQFNKQWSGRILVDRTKLEGSMNTMYLKVGSLQWTPNDRWTLSGGAIYSQSFLPQEQFWDYRFVAETFQDRYYGIASTDLGFCASYKISKKMSVNMAVTNGEGPRIDQDIFGKFKLAGGFTIRPAEGLQFRTFYHHKASGVATVNREQLFTLFGAYQLGNRFRIGGEFNYVDGFCNIPNLVTYGGSVFGNVTLWKTLKLMARYDRLILDNPGATPLVYPVSGHAVITGLSVNPVKGIGLCLNYQGFIPDDGAAKMTNRVLISFEYKL